MGVPILSGGMSSLLTTFARFRLQSLYYKATYPVRGIANSDDGFAGTGRLSCSPQVKKINKGESNRSFVIKWLVHNKMVIR